jgi:hypothetical protein
LRQSAVCHKYSFTPRITAVIPPEGGSFSALIDAARYTFAAGTFTNTVVLTHTLRLGDRHQHVPSLYAIDTPFDVTAQISGTKQLVQPSKPYTLTLQYALDGRYPVQMDTLAWYRWDGQQWRKAPGGRIDTAARTVTATPQQFGRWAVFGATRQVFMPLVRR